MDFETLTFDVDGVHTVVKAIGKGPAVLALHGAATLEGYEWARGLADRFRVYLPFHPGFGESGAAPHLAGMQDMIVHNLHLVVGALASISRTSSAIPWGDGWRPRWRPSRASASTRLVLNRTGRA